MRNQVLEENMGENLWDVWFGDEFWEMTPTTWSLKEAQNRNEITEKTGLRLVENIRKAHL